MKTVFLFLFTFFFLTACSTDDSKPEPIKSSGSSSSGCGTYNGHILHTGEEGGCYYLNSNGNKTYVDRSYCKC